MFLDRVREAFNATGDGELITKGTLREAGIIDVQNGNVLPSIPSEQEYGTPPAPMNLTADGALANVILTWSAPVYLGHAYTEVWAAEEPAGGGNPALGDAVLIGQSPGSVFAHNIGSGAVRWYWVRFVNADGTAGAYNAVEGLQAAPGQDPEYVMDVLSETYGTGGQSPYFQLDAPQTINGVTVPAGTYLYDAYVYNGSITNAKIGDAAIDSAKIADAAIVSAKIGDAEITNAKIADAQVTSAKIADAAITAAKIGDAQITNAKIADGEITNAKIVSLDAQKINAGFISSDRIEAESIGAEKLNVTQLDALSSTIGTFQSAEEGERVRITDDVIEVYDATGQIRVKIGNLNA